jgi:predicted DNA-binding transcriptional regulator YafY
MSSQYFKRLSLIDFYLTYVGSFQRNDLINHFDIGSVTATRDIKEYRKLYPENIIYDVSSKSYVKNNTSFIKKFDHNDETALHFLSSGEWVSEIKTKKLIGIDTQYIKSKYAENVICNLTRAIYSNCFLKVEYTSNSSGKSSKKLFPHSIYQLGSKWYTRAFDVENDSYINLKLSRILSANLSEKSDSTINYLLEDKGWNSELILTVAPHPKLPHPETALLDLNLQDKPVFNIKTNEGIAGIVLSSMKIDITSDASENPFNYQLRLMNRHDLKDLPSLAYLFK